MNFSATLCKEHENKHRLFALIGLFLIYFYAVADLQLELWYRILTHYTDVLMISFIALSFYLRLFKRSWAERFVWLYILWLFITRIFNGDLYLYEEYHLVVRQVALSCAFFSVGFLLDNKDRQRFLDLAIWGVCAYWFILAAYGLYGTINLTRVSLPFVDVTVGMGKLSNYQLMLENTHRNISGVWFAFATVLMICQFFRNRNILLRIIAVIFGIVFYFATAMSFCRSAQIGLCVAIAMLFILLALKKFSVKKTGFKALMITAIIVVVLPLSYMGYSAANSLCTFASSQIAANKLDSAEENTQDAAPAAVAVADPQETASISADEQQPAEEENTKKEENISFEETRGMNNVLILGGRRYIWHAGLIMLREQPARIFCGGISSEYMEEILDLGAVLANRKNPEELIDMHNYIYDALMLTGIPGAVILILFTILLVTRMVKVFFSTKPEVSMGLKILTLPIAMLLVDNMMETHIFRADYAHSFLFFAISGAFLAWSYEVLPCTKKK